mmetsp:Transcript_8721/g.16625  ORF Transcript_8721/g.16625 Transcript_8721/m.16625 type:complete len:81 (-) Transcript_8721:50-292(-)
METVFIKRLSLLSHAPLEDDCSSCRVLANKRLRERRRSITVLRAVMARLFCCFVACLVPVKESEDDAFNEGNYVTRISEF